MGSEPISPHQGRGEWTEELREVLRRARQEGDTRPGGAITRAWLEFRRRSVPSRHVEEERETRG